MNNKDIWISLQSNHLPTVAWELNGKWNNNINEEEIKIS